MELNNKRIVISRTDSIGDVMLTLPMCAWIKKQYPQAHLVFLGRTYTKPIIDCFAQIDEFINWDELRDNPAGSIVQQLRDLKVDVFIHVFPDKELAAFAKKAGIPVRVGTAHRAYHLLTCTHRINFTRKRSPLHEAQLNHFLLKPFGLKEIPELEELYAETAAFVAPSVSLPEELGLKSDYVIIHPGSKGSAVDWPIEHYVELTEMLINKGLLVVLTGSESEGKQFRKAFLKYPEVIDSTGKLDLKQLIFLISKAKALVACSTGPLHIAGFLGIRTIGLFSSRRPIHPGRWQALGTNVRTIVHDPDCIQCKKGKACTCIRLIEPERVLKELLD